MRDETVKLVLGWRDREVVVMDARTRELAAQQRNPSDRIARDHVDVESIDEVRRVGTP